MKHVLYFLAVFVSLFLFFAVGASATDGNGEDFVENFYTLIGRGDGFVEKIGIESLVGELASVLSGESPRILSFLGFMLGSVLLLALAALLTRRYTAAGVCAVVAAGAFGFIFDLVSSATAALSEMSSLFLSLIPIATGVTLAGGGISSSSAEALSMGTVFGVVSSVMIPLLMPLCTVMLFLSVISSIGGGSALALSRVRSVFLWVLGIATAIMLGAISLQTVVLSAKDSAAMRMAKYSASGLIPVIGGTVSASLSALSSGLSYAKGVIGAGGIYVLLVSALSPLLLILIYRGVISLSSGFLSFLGVDDGAKALFGIVCSLDALLSVYGMSVIMYVFELVMFMKSGVAIL